MIAFPEKQYLYAWTQDFYFGHYSVRQGSCFAASDVSALKLTPRRPHAHGETSDNLDELYIVSPQRPADQQSSVAMFSLPMVIHRSGTASTSSTGAASVFPSKPAELLGVFTGNMAGTLSLCIWKCVIMKFRWGCLQCFRRGDDGLCTIVSGST